MAATTNRVLDRAALISPGQTLGDDAYTLYTLAPLLVYQSTETKQYSFDLVGILVILVVAQCVIIEGVTTRRIAVLSVS